MSEAKAMTPEELYLIDEVWHRDCMEIGGEYYYIPVGTQGAYYQSVPRCPDGDIENAERAFRYKNLAFGLDSLAYDEDGQLLISAAKPRPHFDTWQDYFRSLCLAREIPDELEGAI